MSDRKLLWKLFEGFLPGSRGPAKFSSSWIYECVLSTERPFVPFNALFDKIQQCVLSDRVEISMMLKFNDNRRKKNSKNRN